jgi:hypothetical protein
LRASLHSLFDGWVADCPLHYTSPNAPAKRDVLGTVMEQDWQNAGARWQGKDGRCGRGRHRPSWCAEFNRSIRGCIDNNIRFEAANEVW